MEAMLNSLEISIPLPIPRSEIVVNWVTAFPAISPILLSTANLKLILALVAELHKNHMFLATFAKLAKYTNPAGNFNVTISTIMARFIRYMLANLHFLTSSSKFLPYLSANKMPPSCPIPSFRTHVKAAEYKVAWERVLPSATNSVWVEMKDRTVTQKLDVSISEVNFMYLYDDKYVIII